MHIYTIHLPPPYTARHKDPEALREGFSWAAFLFTALWVFWHRMWLRGLMVLGVGIVLGVGAKLIGLDPIGEGIVTLAYMVWVGLAAGDWRRAFLAGRGWRDAGVIAAAGTDGALRRYTDLAALV